MKQFSKVCDKAALYLSELQTEYTDKGLAHPEYSRGGFRNKYYSDVFYNLLSQQQGLCAYSEKRLCRSDLITEASWREGRCLLDGQIKIDGDIEHFDPSLKAAQGWLWDNLFVVRTFINRKIKMTHIVNDCFKPDTIIYSPDNYFQYDLKTHEFKPRQDLDPALQIEVLFAIEKLGINAESTITDRKAYLRSIQADLDYGNKTKEEAALEINQFPTAVRLSGILN